MRVKELNVGLPFRIVLTLLVTKCFVFLPQFFMKATQLEQMKEDYTYIITTKNVTLDTVEKHEEV